MLRKVRTAREQTGRQVPKTVMRGVEEYDDAHACDDGAESSPTSHFVEEKQLMDGGNRFDVKRDEHNEELQLPLLLYDTSTK